MQRRPAPIEPRPDLLADQLPERPDRARQVRLDRAHRHRREHAPAAMLDRPADPLDANTELPEVRREPRLGEDEDRLDAELLRERDRAEVEAAV
jgi:hypothetical protein